MLSGLTFEFWKSFRSEAFLAPVTLALFLCLPHLLATNARADVEKTLIIELLPETADNGVRSPSRRGDQLPQRFVSPLEFGLSDFKTRQPEAPASRPSSPGILPETSRSGAGAAPASPHDFLAEGITVDSGAQGSYSPKIFVHGRAAERMNVFYGSVPLTEFHTLREIFRLVPSNLISGSWTQTGLPNASEASDDFYPTLIYEPCEALCAAVGAPGAVKAHGGFAQMGTESLRSTEVSAGFGAVLSRTESESESPGRNVAAPDLGFWGVDVVRDTGRVLVRDNNNTLASSDDRNVRLSNNDWARQSAVHSSSFLLPKMNTRVRGNLLVSELEEGLTQGPGYLRNETRALRRLGIAEISSDSLLASDGTRAKMNLRLLDTRSSIRRSAAQLDEPAVLSSGNLISFGALIRTPLERNSALHQVTLASDASYLEGSQSIRSGVLQERTVGSREDRISQRLGLAFGLARPAGIDLGLGLTSQILYSDSQVRIGCSGLLDANCNKVAQLSGLASPQSGVLLLLQGQSGKAGLFLRNQMRRPSLMERTGNGTGVLPNTALLDEKREALGIVAGLSNVELTLETAREQDLVVMETGSTGLSQFVNLADSVVRHYASLAMGGEWPGIGSAALRYDYTRASETRNGAQQLPRTPRHVAAVSLSSAEQTLAGSGAEVLFWSFSMAAQWRDRIFLDQKNTLVADGQGSFVPELSLRWAMPASSLRLSAGTVVALPPKTRVRDSLGTATDVDATASGGLLGQEHNYFMKLRGEF